LFKSAGATFLYSFCVLIFSISAHANFTDQTRVAFFVGVDDHTAERVELVPGGKFYHIAIQIEGVWYHASPYNGVERLESLFDLSKENILVSDVLEHREKLVFFDDIKPYLGQGFDYMYDWECKDRTDCTKYVAKLLSIPPTLATFEGEHWQASYIKLDKSLRYGVSPDELYSALLKKGFYSVDFKDYLKSTNAQLSCKAMLIK